MISCGTRYNLRKRRHIGTSKTNLDDDDNVYDSSDSENESINSDDISDDDESDNDDDYEDEEISEDDLNLDLLRDTNINCKLQISILNDLLNDINQNENININSFLNDIEKKINLMELNGDSKDVLYNSSIKLVNNYLKKVISEVRYEYRYNSSLDLKNYIENKIELLNEIQNLDDGKNNEVSNKRKREDKNSQVVLQLMIDPMKYLKNYKGIEDYDDEDYDDEDYDGEDEDESEKYKETPLNELDKKFLTFLKEGVGSPKDEYKYFKDLSDEEKENYLKSIEEIKLNEKIDKPRILKLVDSGTSLNNKSVILNKLQEYDSMNGFNSEYYKMKSWVDNIHKIPFGIYNNSPVTLSSSKQEIRSYLKNVKKHMDDAVYGHDIAKRQIMQVIAQNITNPKEGGTILAIQGPPGVGKTQLIQDGISKALGRPFEFIALGGAQDGTYLEGFEYTYEGSRHGKIVECLIQAKCMNPVIFFDELDKVSGTVRGDEIINILMHLTDVTQNHHFNDRYFQGIDFDLSKAIFIFSFNDESKIDRILKDRMYVIRTEGYDLKDKLVIGEKYMIPNLIKSVGFREKDIQISNQLIEFIIENYTFESGVRRLKECVLEICKEINLRKLSGSKICDKKIKFPIEITTEMLTKEIFSKKNVKKSEKIHHKPRVGLVTGLWANELGLGGILPIEAISIPTNNKLELELTGQLGDVMKESMKCAKTVAWNLIPSSVKEKLNEEWKSFGCTGIHIHCPDTAMPKDGPSAGGAITTAIISILMNEPVDNKIAMTGEINLRGEITEIGGLKEKLNGAKKAGVEHVLIPYKNTPEYDKVIQNDPTLLCDTFKVTKVKNIWEIFDICFTKKIKTKKY